MIVTLHRTDSDIFRSYSDTIYDWPRQDNETVLGERLRKKDKLVAWFVSHCTTHSIQPNASLTTHRQRPR